MKNVYRVYIADRLTKMPLAYYDVLAWTKAGAKLKIFKEVCSKDDSYLLTAIRKEQ